MFDLPENKSIPKMEDDVIAFWKKNKIFEKSIEQRPKGNLYVFYDGPPFISGLPHYGHLLGSIAKDIIPRYWTMKGKRVERVWGWDAHGLTVENKVQKKLGIKERKDIEKFGLEKFTEECYKYTSETSAEWDWYIDKIGRWVDMENAYKTIDRDYMESVIWAFKKLYDKGLIYEGVRTSLYCPTCGTPVSNFEISMDDSYKEVQDPAIVAKFKFVEGDLGGIFGLAWTTTPWTLPSNKALVVDENEDYVVFEKDGERYLVAEKRLEDVGGPICELVVQEKVPGSSLIGLSYQPLYEIYPSNDKDFKIYSYEDMVNMEEGTGIVHSAPGFGDVDTRMGQHYGLSLTMAIDDEGKFQPPEGVEVIRELPLQGVYFKKADSLILEDLRKRNLLFKTGTIVHRYPYHDRCDTLLIHRAQNSWFVDVQALKSGMFKHNEAINWVPKHIKNGQFKEIIQNAPDWCISRTRFWAAPMPIWETEDGERIVVGSIKELEDLSGKKVKDLHRPYIDQIEIKKDGKVYKRLPDVLDCWFESASMPYAQMHYPFEKQEKFENNFPGDYVVEYIAQVRAWFNVMHRLSTGLFGSHAFRNVIATGVMAGNDGRKMSKTYQNYTDPKEVLETFGGDALRLYLMNSPLMVGENMNFDDVELRTKARNVLNPLWNSLKFFLIYAKKYKWEPNKGKRPEVKHVLDIWIITRLQETIRDISSNLELYQIPSAVQPVEDFVDDLSRWYVRRSRDRISKGDTKALATFYYVLINFIKAAAPVIPFMAEGIYQHLKYRKMPESVHLCNYPAADSFLIDENYKVLKQMDSDRKIVSNILAIRAREGIPVRQVLACAASIDLVSYPDIVSAEVNVKEFVDIKEALGDAWKESADKTVKLDTALTEELKIEGASRELIRKIQRYRKKFGFSVGDTVNVVYEDTLENKKAVEKFGDEIKNKVAAKTLTPGKEYAVEKV